MRIETARQLDDLREETCRSSESGLTRVLVGTGTCGEAAGALKVYDAIVDEVERLGAGITVVETGCMGVCFLEPVVEVVTKAGVRITYAHMTVEDAPSFVDAVYQGRVYTPRAYAWTREEQPLLGDAPVAASGELPLDISEVTPRSEIPFFAKQTRIAMRNCGIISPTSITEYIAAGGYSAAAKALTSMTPEEICDEVERANLRGRGGGGYPAGRKWQSCRKAKGKQKYIICNADEGDPGAYMDRGLIEGDPHSVLEGMLIGARAINCGTGFIYIRTEYPKARLRLEEAIAEARDYGLLGENILGTGFDFDIEIKQGAGAFVCGESSALMASIEGNPPEPRPKTGHATSKGLWRKPTVLNNVETFANVPVIIAKGSRWFKGMGTDNSPGTKVFSLVGKVNNTGLVEVMMGITIREIVFEMGGGIPDDREFKAVQTGGPSGGCIPASLLDMPVDFDNLWEAGSMMGSGGMIVMDERTCMVDLARYFVRFCNEESCGKCTSCRDGSDAILVILDKLCDGEGEETDVALLRELCDAISEASHCGLGKSLPNPVISTMKYFASEYEAHVLDRSCPAHVCKKLIHYTVDPDKCKKEGLCFRNCASNAIDWEKKCVATIDWDRCVRCGVCFDLCKFDAISAQ